MFLRIIRIPPELALVIIVIALIAAIYSFIRNLRFLNKMNVATAEADITDCESTRYNHLYYINTFKYRYIVEGETYEKEDKECIVLKKNREGYPSKDTVEYLKSNPSCSRLQLINRKFEMLKNILSILFVIAAGIYIYVFYLM